MSLTPLDVDALVQLRALLTHAQQVSRIGSRTTRLVAVILLDAVNERATHLVATTRGVEISGKSKFEDLVAKVKEELGASWQANSWSEVRRLHRVRNSAQHEGAGADRDEIAGWRAATEKYTRALVQAAFAVDIDQVMLGEAIDSLEIRDALTAAETHLRAGDPFKSIVDTERAFTMALESWRKAHKQDRQYDPFRRGAGRDEYGQLVREIEILRDLTQAQLFAPDPAEYLWFAEVVAAEPRSISLGEAERALVFAFWWLVGWQAAAPSFEGDRQSRWVEASRKVRSSSGPARIVDIRVEHRMLRVHTDARRLFDPAAGEQREELVINFLLEDVPAPHDFAAWQKTLSDQLRKCASTQSAHIWVSDVGNVQVSLPSHRDEVLETLVRDLTQSLNNVEEELARAQAARELARLAQERASAEFSEQVRARRHDLPEWVRELSLGESFQGPTLQLRVPPEVGAVVSSQLRAADCVDYCFGESADGDLRLGPRIGLDELVVLLAELDEMVTSTLGGLEQASRRAQDRKTSIEMRLRQALLGPS